MEEQVARSLLSAIDQPLVLIDKQQRIIFANSNLRRLLQLEKEEELPDFLGQLLACVEAPEAGTCGQSARCAKCKMWQITQKAFDDDAPGEEQDGLFLLRKGRQPGPWRLRFSVHPIALEKPALLLTFHSLSPAASQEAVNENTGETRTYFAEAHPQLPDTQASLHAYFRHNKDGIMVLNALGELVVWNNQLVQLMECTPEEARAQFLNKLLTLRNPEKDGLLLDWPMIKQMRHEYHQLEGLLTTCKQRDLMVQLTITPIYTEQGALEGSILIIEDLSREKSYKEQMELHRFSLEFSPSEFYYLNKQGKILYANRQARENFDDKPEGKNIAEINQAIDLSWWKQIMRALQEEDYLEFEAFHHKGDGSLHPVRVHVFMPDRSNSGLYCYYCNDISGQKQVEANLLKESRYNQSLAEISKELTVHNQLTSVKLLVRQYALEITESDFAFLAYRNPLTQELRSTVYSDPPADYNNAIMLLESYFCFHAPDKKKDTEGLRSFSDRIINKEDDLLINEQSIRKLLPFERFCITGIYFNQQFKGIIVVAGKGSDYEEDDLEHLQNLSNMFALAINRIQEEDRLLETIDQLELAMQVANIFTFDARPLLNEFTTTSQYTEGESGKTARNRHLLNNIIDKVHPEDLPAAMAAVEEHRNSNSPSFKVVTRMRMKGKQYRWYESSGRIMRLTDSGEIERVVGLSIDITEEKELNQQLIASREEAIAANKAKSAFLARISHEFRTPLNAIIGFTDVLNNTVSDPVQKEYLLSIKKSGQNLLRLITDILDYSKIEAGKIELQLRPVNLVHLICETETMFIPNVKEKGLVFNVVVDEPMPRLLLLDDLQVRQILINLLGNAIKFTERGSVDLYVRAEEGVNNMVDLTFRITDTGIGIKAESLKKIFEDFTQQDDQDNRRFGGTGLGLGIVRSIVQLMGGSIDVESSPGAGSAFTVTLKNCKIVAGAEGQQADQLPKVLEQKGGDLVEIAEACREAVHEALKNVWPAFRQRMSFKQIPDLAGILREAGKTHDDRLLQAFAERLQKSADTFDVEALNRAVVELEEYAKLKDL